MLEKTLEITMLYDFYGKLLTERQAHFLEFYYHHDLSLGEIAENAGVTRQAVYDILRRAERALRGYEDALGLVAEYHRRQAVVRRCIELLGQLAASTSSPAAAQHVAELRRLITDELP